MQNPDCKNITIYRLNPKGIKKTISLNRYVNVNLKKKLILYISILLISVLLSACSESSSKEINVVQGLMYDYKITEKQVKCLIKETKPLVKKDEWNKYVEMWNARANGQDKMDNNNMESLMNVGIAMIGIGEKCNVTF